MIPHNKYLSLPHSACKSSRGITKRERTKFNILLHHKKTSAEAILPNGVVLIGKKPYMRPVTSRGNDSAKPVDLGYKLNKTFCNQCSQQRDNVGMRMEGLTV